MHNIFNHLLASLCIGDLLFLICNLLLVPIALGVDNIVTKFLYPIAECGYVMMRIYFIHNVNKKNRNFFKSFIHWSNSYLNQRVRTV